MDDAPTNGSRPSRGRLPDLPGERLAEADQTLSDNEQTLGERDQTLSDRDQQACDDDQAASDWDVDHRGDPAGHADATAARVASSRERDENSAMRDRTADERDTSARRRDELSQLRDEIALEHDEEARTTDVRDDVSDRHTLRVEELRGRARASRIRAGADRDRGARDRAQAAGDRVQAAGDRELAASDREQAGTDELTGARRRGVGLEELENEIRRARREKTSLVAAYVDVDGLKAFNDGQGHAAGDDLLRSVADGLRDHMRSYDLLVRLGGDEFLCALPNVSIDEARRRFGDLSSKVGGSAGNSVSIGFSLLRDGDSRDDFVKRADGDLLASRGH